jgi:hypothetical protein
MSAFTPNAALASHQRADYVTAARRDAVTQALAHIDAGQPGAAVYVLTRATHRLARIAGPHPDPATAAAAYAECLRRMERGEQG